MFKRIMVPRDLALGERTDEIGTDRVTHLSGSRRRTGLSLDDRIATLVEVSGMLHSHA
ncbi:hypothetical protein [Halomonas caseinilytica]|uniref:hypothetical protein n=1 Tax=Halomonas caseinilytica TaxID=438744 RepID=UPI0008BEFE1C|nr:hypothetical protein [Halomonas caseinilytica]SEM40139.1 hypothetical protein SAMN04487952_103248 [Halomonas caseinilytica]